MVVDDVDRYEVDARMRSVAVTTDNRADDKANARLIAAAPELYEVVAAMREWAEVGGTLSMYASFTEEQTFGEVILAVLKRAGGGGDGR